MGRSGCWSPRFLDVSPLYDPDLHPLTPLSGQRFLSISASCAIVELHPAPASAGRAARVPSPLNTVAPLRGSPQPSPFDQKSCGWRIPDGLDYESVADAALLCGRRIDRTGAPVSSWETGQGKQDRRVVAVEPKPGAARRTVFGLSCSIASRLAAAMGSALALPKIVDRNAAAGRNLAHHRLCPIRQQAHRAAVEV